MEEEEKVKEDEDENVKGDVGGVTMITFFGNKRPFAKPATNIVKTIRQ